MDKITDRQLDGIVDDPTGVNSHTVRAMAQELRAFRAADGALPPDFQICRDPVPHPRWMVQMQEMADEVRAMGGDTLRLTAHEDGKVYMDGWRKLPIKMAEFNVSERFLEKERIFIPTWSGRMIQLSDRGYQAPEPELPTDPLYCPTCKGTAPRSEWRETEVGCEDCGDHAAMACPLCDEVHDTIYVEIGAPPVEGEAP